MSLVLKDVRKVFADSNGTTVAVEGFDYEIKKGLLFTLLGPSGCGKTTTLRIIAGFEIPTNGKVFLEGNDVTNLPPNRRNISMVFQSYALFPHLDVMDNISFGLKIKRLNSKKIKKKANDMIDLVGLRGLENRRPDQLSGGQQQRVALARSLVMEPQVLLFDEPLSNLDAKLRESMRLEIRRIQQELSITSVYVTHDQVEAMSISDLIVVMDKGKMMQVGSPFEIYAHPRNAFVADFIGRVNFLEGTVTEANGEEVAVDCESLKKKFVCTTDLKLDAGEKVTVVLRPESLSDRKEDRENEIEGIVKKYVFLGSSMEFEFMLDNGQTVNAVLYNPAEQKIPRINERRTLYFSKKSAWTIKT